MRPQADDGILDEWFPAASVHDVEPGTVYPFRLLGERFVLVRTTDGTASVFRDTCPHRGAQLSLGSFDGDRIQCPYHGWQFSSEGRCVFQPAHPGQTPGRGNDLRPVAVADAYGLYWVCIGIEPRRLPEYPEFAAHPGRTVYLGPAALGTSGPRIIENFLDMAHFPFVHRDYLGQPPHTEVRPYDIAEVDGDLVITNCVFWQPNPGPTATEGGDVDYRYGVPGPYTATLTKIPSAADGGSRGAFSLLLVASPEDEFSCRTWMLTTVHDPDLDVGSFDAFNQIIFTQDIPIVESQRPRRLPLGPKEEVHQKADKVSLAYRRHLTRRRIRYGTTANGGPEEAI